VLYRAAFSRLRALGLIVSACSVALVAHLLLQLSDGSSGTPAYATHEHGSLPVVVAAIGISALAIFVLYALHLLRSGPRSLPLLARAMHRCLDVRAFAGIFAAAIATLGAMELAEEASLSLAALNGAFDGRPALAIAAIALAALVAVVALRVLCVWLEQIHQRIAGALCALVHLDESALAPAALLPHFFALTACSARCMSRILGMRAPPIVFAA